MSLLDKALLEELRHRLSPNEFRHLKYRRTGRSTARALLFLGQALAEPGKPIPIRDHYGSPKADEFLMGTMQDMARKLGLEHLVWDKCKHTVTFAWKNPFNG